MENADLTICNKKIRNAKNFEITDTTERQRPDQMLNEGVYFRKIDESTW